MNVVKASQLSKTYNNGVKAVNELDLNIQQGEVFGFLGPNGAGKTTTIGMIIGLVKPTAGSISILGQSMPEEADDVVSRIGFIPQELIFYQHLTVEENLELFSSCYEISDTEHRIAQVLRLLQIKDLQDRRADTLSGGQKRRLNLAIGLLHQPEILFLDEPSAGMDPQTRNALWQAIEDISDQGMTIVLTTHLMETADRLSDRVGIMDNGRIVAVGTPRELKNAYGRGDTIIFSIRKGANLDTTSLEYQLQERYNTSVQTKDRKLSIQVMDGLSKVSSIIDTVEQKLGNHVIKGITVEENTLEDVFVTITQKELR